MRKTFLSVWYGLRGLVEKIDWCKKLKGVGCPCRFHSHFQKAFLSKMSSSLKTIDFARSSSYKWYGITTDELKELNALAVNAEYNRSISDEGIALLKPDVIHPIQCVIADHTNYAGKFSIRAMVMAYMTDEEKPEMVMLDISHRKWNAMMSKRRPVPSK